MTNTSGCPDCGMAYSFFFGVQFHTATCPAAVPVLRETPLLGGIRVPPREMMEEV